MSDSLHNAIAASVEQHAVHRWAYATAALREAATGFVTADVGKVAQQQDDGSYWVLADESPILWLPVTGGLICCRMDASAGLATGDTAIGALPDNAYVVRSWYDVVTQPASATSTADLSFGVASDDAVGIVAATVVSDAIWAAGAHDAVQDGTAAAFTTKTTAARDIIATVANEALTDGVVNLFIEYATSA